MRMRSTRKRAIRPRARALSSYLVVRYSIMPKRKRTSVVWQHFQLVEVPGEDGKTIKKAECSMCETKLVYTGGTTNLLNHLEIKHPLTYKEATGEASGTKSQKTLSRSVLLIVPVELRTESRNSSLEICVQSLQLMVLASNS